MENKESGTTRPVGICEKLFNALHLSATFRSLRRIAYHSQEPVAVAAAKPASLPPVRSVIGDGPAPPTSKSSGLEYSSGAVAVRQVAVAARQVSEKKVPEPKVPKVESERVTIPLKVPSKVELPAVAEPKVPKVESERVTIPLKVPSKVEPPAVAAAAAAAAAAAGVTAIPSKKVNSVESQPPPPSRLPTERSVDSMAPAPEVGRTRTRRNLNDRVDEYINRTMNRLKTSSNAGGPSSSSK